jgi:two-component system response regulator RegX3
VAATTDPTYPAPPAARAVPAPVASTAPLHAAGVSAMTSYDVDMASGRRTILLVEDEPAIAEPLAETLTREGFHLEVAGTAAGAVDAVARVRPDLILLDLMLPDGSGFDVCREVRRDSQVPIIMLTARGDETDRVIGLELGADDYVVKPFSAREVTARVRAVLRRTATAAAAAGTGDGNAPVEVGDVRLEPGTRSVTKAGAAVEVTRKEFDLLALLMRSAGSVVTRERLIDEVWDVNWFGSTKTLDVHVSGLRKKLGDDSAAPRYIHTVRGVGFMFASAEEASS